MTVSLIQVPYVLGDERQGAGKGPGRLLEAGVDKVLAAKGIAVKVERIDRGGPFRDNGNASLTVCKQLAEEGRTTVQAGGFPVAAVT
jgi:arginase